MGRRHSRRCLLMSSLLAKTAPEQVSSSNLLWIMMPFVSIRYLPLFLMKFFGWHAISFSSRVRRMNYWLLSTMIAFKMWYPFMIKGLHCQSRTQHGRHFVKILWSISRRLLKSSNRTFLIYFHVLSVVSHTWDDIILIYLQGAVASCILPRKTVWETGAFLFEVIFVLQQSHDVESNCSWPCLQDSCITLEITLHWRQTESWSYTGLSKM